MRHNILILSALLCLFSTNNTSAQQKQDALYVFRNDGKFAGFFYDEITNICYSKTDTLGIEQEDYVVQEIHTLDSVYRIPVSAIDSVAFVTPETVYKSDVAHTTESDLWNYVIGSDSVRTLLLKKNTPKGIIPKSGDKLVTTKSRDYLPGGFYAIAETITNTDEGILVSCTNPDLIELFDQYTAKARIWDNSNSDARHRASGGNDDENYENYVTRYHHQKLPSVVVDLALAGNYDLGNNWSVTGSGSLNVGFTPAVRAEGFLNVSSWTGTKAHLLLSVMNESWLDLKLKATIAGSFDKKLAKKKIWIPDSPFFVDIVFGVSPSISGDIELSYYYRDWTHAWLSAQYDSRRSDGTGFLYKLTAKEKNNDFNVVGHVAATFGPYVEAMLSAVDETIAKGGLRVDAGVKAEISSQIKLQDFATLAMPLPSLLYTMNNPTGIYDVLNRDGGIKVGVFCTGKFVAAITSKWKLEKPIFDLFPGWDWEGGFVPKFSNLTLGYDTDNAQLKASANLSRRLVVGTPVGFIAYNKDGKRLSTQWGKSYEWKKNEQGTFEPSMKKYSLNLSSYQMGGTIRVYPILSFFNGKYEMLCSPYKEIFVPVTLDVSPKEFAFDAIGGSRVMNLTSNIDWNCENEQYVIDVDYGKIDWAKVTGNAPTLKLEVDKNTSSEPRSGELTLKLTSPQNQKVDTSVKVKVEQEGQEQKQYMFLGSWYNGEGKYTNNVTFGEDGSYYFEQRTNGNLDFTRIGTYVVKRYKEYGESSSIRMEADITETFVTSSTGKTNTKDWTIMLLSDGKLSYRNTYFYRTGGQ